MIQKLTAEDFMVACTKGAIRQLMAIKYDRMGHDHGGTSHRSIAQRLGDSVIGELGEMAVSRTLGLPITSHFESTSASDVSGFEVRCTEYQNGHLLLHKSSPDWVNYVLVVINRLEARIPGWIVARDGKQDSYWRNGDPGCFYVPQSALNSIEELRGLA
jgi:hypothetical protein